MAIQRGTLHYLTSLVMRLNTRFESSHSSMTLFPIINASDCEVMGLKTEERDDDTGGSPCALRCSQATAPSLPTLSLLPQIYPWLSTSIPFIVFLFNAVIHAAVALSKRLEDQNWIDRYYLILGV